MVDTIKDKAQAQYYKKKYQNLVRHLKHLLRNAQLIEKIKSAVPEYLVDDTIEDRLAYFDYI